MYVYWSPLKWAKFGWEENLAFRGNVILYIYNQAAQILGKPDLAPAAWVRRLVTLCDKAPATPVSTVQQIIEEELGQSFSEIFEQFEAEPIGSASIAQVWISMFELNKFNILDTFKEGRNYY